MARFESTALDCPHCFKLGAGLTNIGIVPRKPGTKIDMPINNHYEAGTEFSTFWRCNLCGNGIIIAVKTKNKWHDSPNSSKVFEDVFETVQIFPQITLTELPDHMPEEVANAFKDAEICYRGGGFDLSITGMRTVLERALVAYSNMNSIKRDAPITELKNLCQEIKTLAKDNYLTASMADWADIIKDFGNDSSHRPCHKNVKWMAEEIKNFTIMFLTYAFTMPYKVKELRKLREQSSSAPDNTLPSPEEP
jgi:hypothetical protein